MRGGWDGPQIWMPPGWPRSGPRKDPWFDLRSTSGHCVPTVRSTLLFSLDILLLKFIHVVLYSCGSSFSQLCDILLCEYQMV